MMKRRLKDIGLPLLFSPHSFRVTTITDPLEQGVPPPTCSASPATLTRVHTGLLRLPQAEDYEEYCREDFYLDENPLKCIWVLSAKSAAFTPHFGA